MSNISNNQNGNENAKKSVSRSETGHMKNVANFEDMISFCIGYGPMYNPSNVTLKIESLQNLHQTTKDILDSIKSKRTAFDNAVDKRRNAFEDLKSYATRILNSFMVSGADKLTIQNAKSINKKLQGVSAKATKVPTETELSEGEEIKRISTSQQSYDRLSDHFSTLLEIVLQSGFYNPNEADLKISAMQEKLQLLHATNTEVVNTYTPYSNARIERDNLLYNKLTGLNAIAQLVKKYVKSVFGANSPQFKQISGIEIRDSQ